MYVLFGLFSRLLTDKSEAPRKAARQERRGEGSRSKPAAPAARGRESATSDTGSQRRHADRTSAGLSEW